LVSLFLLAAMLATSVSPVVLKQLRKDRSAGGAILLTVLGIVVIGALTALLVGLSITSLAHKLPFYEARLVEVGDSLTSFLAARGIVVPELKTLEALSPERLVGYAAILLGALISLFSNAMVVLLLVIFILIEGASKRLQHDRGQLPPDSWWAQFFNTGADVRTYISITAFTGFLGALANLVLLVILGVDGAGLWAFLSFLFNFIPNFGFILSVVPPAVLALLEFGIARTLIVVVGFVVANAVVENVLKPRFIGTELDLSILEIFLSLMFWGFVLGAAGAILAVPLTIVVKRLIPALMAEGTQAEGTT
jgi:predicted PurR-regulated permease PerM